jgi:hypothetical protein
MNAGEGTNPTHVKTEPFECSCYTGALHIAVDCFCDVIPCSMLGKYNHIEDGFVMLL